MIFFSGWDASRVHAVHRHTHTHTHTDTPPSTHRVAESSRAQKNTLDTGCSLSFANFYQSTHAHTHAHTHGSQPCRLPTWYMVFLHIPTRLHYFPSSPPPRYLPTSLRGTSFTGVLVCDTVQALRHAFPRFPKKNATMFTRPWRLA